MNHLRWIGALVLAGSLAGCGAGAHGGAGETMEASGPVWTDAQLRKLEPSLRQRVRRGGGERIAVRVFFLELPTDSELAELLLNRLGEQAIGQVEPEDLRRIAARRDVERIEPLTDVGYAEP
jgi:hypothetical protein